MGYYRPASKTPLKWRFAGVPMMTFKTLNPGLVALWGSGPILLENPVFL